MCDCQSKPHLTEDDVRRIVSEALLLSLTAVTNRATYGHAATSGLKINGIPVHEA